MIRSIVSLSFALLLFSCGEKQSTKQTEIAKQKQKNTTYFSEEIINILEFQDQRLGDSILPFFNSKDSLVREIAALSFASILDSVYTKPLFDLYQNELSLNVKKACIHSIGQRRDSTLSKQLVSLFSSGPKWLHYTFLEAIGKCGGRNQLKLFLHLLMEEEVSDLAVSNGVLRYSYATKNYMAFKDYLWDLLNSSNEKTRLNGAMLMLRIAQIENGLNPNDSNLLLTYIEKEPNTEIQKLFDQIQKAHEKPETIEITKEVKNQIKEENAPYTAAKTLQKIKVTDYEGLNFLLLTALNAKHQTIKTNAADALIRNLSNPQLIINRQPKTYYLQKLLASGDMALESIATYGIRNESIVSKEEAQIVFAKPLLALWPKYTTTSQKETYLDIAKTMDYLEITYNTTSLDNTERPLDWNYILSIPKNQKVRVKTEKGIIVMECKVQEAPGSVSNFLKLIDSGYYDGKYFHRVVPNFVIQTGCFRGDGWGASEWTQRTEVSNYLSYTKGTVGLASAGYDTESIQWFITHQSTPFLDGRYTIFAKVIEGFDVIENIELGDKILKVEKVQ